MYLRIACISVQYNSSVETGSHMCMYLIHMYNHNQDSISRHVNKTCITNVTKVDIAN